MKYKLVEVTILSKTLPLLRPDKITFCWDNIFYHNGNRNYMSTGESRSTLVISAKPFTNRFGLEYVVTSVKNSVKVLAAGFERQIPIAEGVHRVS